MVPFKETITTKAELIEAAKKGFDDFQKKLVTKNDFCMFFGFIHGEAIERFYKNDYEQLLVDGGFNRGSGAYFSGGINAWKNLRDGIYEFPPLSKDGHKQSVNKDLHLQQIYYGAPGTGKSHEIKVRTQGDDTVIRTTFHPDSDYSTFVGCYKPTMGKTRPIYGFDATGKTVKVEDPKGTIVGERRIEYNFVKQAFTKAYIQAWEKMCRTTPSATPTATIPAGSAILPYSRTGKLGENPTFMYVPQGATLSEDESDKLNEVDNFDFPFEGIDNFAELHNSGITVVVTDKPQEDDERYHKKIKFTAMDIRELYALWENDKKRYWFLVEQGLLRIIYDKLKKEKKLKEDSGEILVTDPLVKLKDYTGESVTIEINESNTLLGKYVSNTVYLYKDNIRIWGYGEELELLCAVYVHEMFHAYFDMVPHQTISEIEEPIVECSTLCFLELFDNTICDSYLNHVRRKQQSSAICYYGFGAYLYENRSLDWMSLYQKGFGKIIENSPIVEQYKNKFFPAYRFAEEQSTMDILYNILNPQSKAVFGKSAQFLIIEEINRGNCAQIFGDLFQLLDRNENGYSEYPIVPDDDLKNVLAEDFAGLTLGADVKSRIDAIFKENYPAGIADKILSGELLVLPENLYIWATMNTSDQSLFPIDSAFKRRWDWKYMPIGYKNTNWIIEIGNEKYKWVDFQRIINEKIYEVDSSEDKKLGDYFVNADRTGGKITADTLLNKILFYLWNDVCKDDPDQIFRWIDDKKEEKSIKFSEFFEDDREKKLQGFMEFLGIDAIDENEGFNDPNDGNSEKEEKGFSYNGTPASMREIAASVISDYAKTHSGLNAQQVRDYFIKTFKSIGIAHIVETESEYRQRDGQKSQKRTVTPVTIPNGETIYVSTQWRAGSETDNFYLFMEIVNNNNLGSIEEITE